MPNAVEVRGNPRLVFPANIDIGDTISSALIESIGSIDGAEIIQCKNTSYQTYLIYMNLSIEATIPLPENSYLMVSPNSPVDFIELYKESEPINIPLSSMKKFMNGFSLSEAKTKLYLRASHGYNDEPFDDMIENLSIKLTIDGVEQEPFKITGEDVGLSGFKERTEYNDNKAPDGGHEIPGLILDGEDKEINFQALLIRPDVIDFAPNKVNVSLAAEVVIWLPLILEAGSKGGTLTLPIDDFFTDGDDLLCRESADSENPITDIIQSLEFSIKLNSTLFNDSNLVVSSVIESPHDEIRIVNRLKGSSLNFAVSEQNMQRINNHFPFSPKFSVEFEPGRILAFPWNLSVNEIALKAKIKYRIDL